MSNFKLIPPIKKDRFQIIPSVYLLLLNTETNQILLSKRCGTGFMDGYWSLPAGHVEKNETIFEAIIRESKEEINLDINQNQLSLFHLRHHTDEARFNFYFVYKDLDFARINNNEPNKCSQLRWFDIYNLPSKIITSVKEVIVNFRKTLKSKNFKNYNNIYTFTDMSEPIFNQKTTVQTRER